ncbi:Druantia anti-phage system protein DruA [Bacillus sp. T33-2]|uniref:Druantia anti-phage system protein DruA n=1 Tax=Bacillus sp. T33-2 TaxID=2054168 RepID=UPI0015E11DD0|nr:Druantia anti-phage system protein DruA [Bacillus sp. T33-2]
MIGADVFMNKYILQPNLPTGAAAIINIIYDALNKKESIIKLESIINKAILSVDFNTLLIYEQLTVKLFFEILMDFTRQGWEFSYKDNNLIAYPPDELSLKSKNVTDIKNKIKRGLEEARNKQLNKPAIKRFIFNQERPRMFKGRKVSILNHFLNPIDLYNDLINRLNSPEELRHELIAESIKPYIQLVKPNERDQFTNIKLGNIWRYARYSWSLPLNSMVGRQLRYLIRDASRDFHPIIGLGELANSIAQISCRDEEIGWSLKAMEESPNKEDQFNSLEQALNNTLETEYYYEDLLDVNEIEKPTDETLRKLKCVIDGLKPIVEKNKPYKNTSSIINDTLREDYTLKRAQDLSELLHCRIWFQLSKKNHESALNRFHWLLTSKDGKKALKNAIKNVKKIYMGATMMDISTCGALPPYSDLLGGKLVSLLMASPKVINDYNERYKTAESHIASRKKGEKVIKPATLTLLVTSSLYYTGSSQYNRIKYSTEKGTIKYSCVGKTRGFGSVHISDESYKLMHELLVEHPDLKPEANNFSAGVNYKMRTISNSLGFLGLRKLQQHENPRLVYLIPLAVNWKEYLTGVDKSPKYIFDLDKQEEEIDGIINFWKKRWYIDRINKREILNSLRYKEGIKISNFINSTGDDDLDPTPSNTNLNHLPQLESFGAKI